MPCVDDYLCPPLGKDAEQCTAGSEDRPFDMGQLGFPGPYCENAIGGELRKAGDLGTCVAYFVEQTATAAVNGIFGGLAVGAALSEPGIKCLDSASKGSGKFIREIFKSALKCRGDINKGKRTLNPVTCVDDDPRLEAKIAKAEAKLRDLMETRCTTDAIMELDPCGNGIGSTSSVEAATDCLVALARETADAHTAPATRRIAAVSLVEGVYPPAPRCGDNLVNQLPNPFLLLGEECDGTADSSCPGKCLPPGDLFECTCGDIPRLRFFASDIGSETDAGWTGLSHNQFTADLSGFVVNVENCDCSRLFGATCVGTTSDPVCDLAGETLPVCSHSPQSKQDCDATGDGDGANEDADCYICDGYSENPGDTCADDDGCQSLCYDGLGAPQGSCRGQSDCALGETCRGRCDKRQYCIRTPNGGPLPVTAAGASVCGVQTFRSDVVGTMNLVTGSHEIYFQLRSQIHTGEDVSRPCPVCGGFCVDGANESKVCYGTCESSALPCRFDQDCLAGEECTTASTDCPGGFCELSLVCGANPDVNPEIVGKPCRVTAEHRFFGTISNDCLPASTSNTTGRGLEIDYLPWTSGSLTLPSTVPCTAVGFELYECPCPDDGGHPSKPNECSPACNAPGPQFGIGCADGDSFGDGTVCASGPNVGRLCDDDDDCPQSSCARNPMHCTGDPEFERHACANNADCGIGSCVDACIGGRCVPLCVPTIEDGFDGECAAGPPTYHCDGEKFRAKSCSANAVDAGCSAVCSGSGSQCVGRSDCPADEACEGACAEARDCSAGSDGQVGTADDLEGAGRCVEDVRSCFLDPIVAEGGSTLNGRGSPTNMLTAGLFCQKRSLNIGANAAAGFGGPTRVRVNGRNIPNFVSIP